jgi:membrane protein
MASNRFSRLLKIFTGTNSGDEAELLQLEGKLERTAHFIALVWRQYVRNRCLVRASSLAYTTLLALIPLLAFVISISNSLLKNVDEEKIYQTIASLAPHTPWPTNAATGDTHPPPPTDDTEVVTLVTTNLAGEVETNFVSFPATEQPHDAAAQATTQKELARWLKEFVGKTQNATLGFAGIFFFGVIGILMLSRIEETFNDIWGVAQGRDWRKRVPVYWMAISFGPPMLLLGAGLAGGQHVQAVKDYFYLVPSLGNFIFKFLPLVVLWFTFALVYQMMPNAKVKFPAALAGGVVAGTLWHLNNVFGFIYVARTIQSSQMYGALALVPVFMLGLYFSWAILLFGAQFAYVFQNRAAYLQDKLADNVNQRGREFVALRIMTLIGQRFQNGLRPASLLQLSTELGVPTRLTQQILRTLAAARLVTEVGGAETAYVPARPLETVNAHHILLALRAGSGRDLAAAEMPALAEIYGEFARIEEAERTAAEKISMLDLVLRTPMPTALNAPQTTAPAKQIAAAPVVEEKIPAAAEPAPEVPAPEPMPELEPEHAEAAAVASEQASENSAPAPAATKPAREVVRPEERDFPL